MIRNHVLSRVVSNDEAQIVVGLPCNLNPKLDCLTRSSPRGIFTKYRQGSVELLLA